jgi:DHA1 family tetracycline resistance protein-like MFS transporter
VAVAANRHATAFVFVTVLLDMVGFGLIMPVLPALIEDISGKGIADATLISGWLYFAYGGMQFLCGPLIGNLSDAYGRRPLLLLSVFGLGIDYFLSALAPTLWWLFVGRVVAGLCGASYSTANAYIADVTAPEERAKAFGLMGAAFGFGFVIGPAIGGLLGEYGARVPFFVAAAISLLNFVYGYFVLPETLPRERRRPFTMTRANPLGAFKVFSSYRQVLPLLAVLFFYMLATSVYPAIWPFWGIAAFGWSESTIGLTLAAFGIITAIVQGALTGPAVKKLGENGAALVGLASAAIAAAGYAFAPNLTWVLILLVIHAPEGIVFPALSALMSKEAPADAQGELQGGIASTQNLSMLIGTLLFAQVFGYTMSTFIGLAFLLSAAIIVISIGIYALHGKR